MSVFGDGISVLSLLISGKLLAYWRASFLFRQTLLTYDRQLLITLRLLYSVDAFPLSYCTTPVLFSTSASALWAKLPHQLELAESLNLNLRSGNGVLVRNAAMAEKRSLLALTGAIIRLRKLRLCETGPRMILLLL